MHEECAAVVADAAARVALLGVDSAFAAGIPPEDQALARRILAVPRLELAPGPWRPELGSSHEAPRLLLVEGLVTRENVLRDRSAAELLGPGDVVGGFFEPDRLVPATVNWTVALPSVVAVLDGTFASAARRWPSLTATLQARLLSQVERSSVHGAIRQLPRVDLRVLAILWLLAERWGTVTPEGVRVALRLTHDLLGRLVGARRPTVTLALRDLIEAGLVHRRPDGGWVLRRGSQELLSVTGGI